MEAVTAGVAIASLLTALIYLAQAWIQGPRNRCFAEYFFDRWSLQSLQVAATLFSSAMSFATVVIALMQLTGVFGIGLCTATATFCIGWVAIQGAAGRIRRRSVQTDTLHSFLGRYYNSILISKLAAVVTIIGLLGLFCTELFAIDEIVRSLTLSSPVGASLIILFGCFAILHAALGGFHTVVRSDPYQSILLLISLVILLILGILAWRSTGYSRLNFKGQADTWLPPISIMVGLFMINAPFPFVDTLTWQRLIAAASIRDYVRGSWLAVAAFSFTWTLLVVIGLMAGTANSGSDPFSNLIQYCGVIPSWLGFVIPFLIFPGFFSAMLSSSDAFLNSAVHTWCLDVIGYRSYDKEANVRNSAALHVVWLGAVGLTATMFLRYLGFNIVDMIFAVYAGTLALLPAVLYSIFRPTQRGSSLRTGVVLSMSLGLAAAWTVGLAATIPGMQKSHLTRALDTLHLLSVYHAPTVAVAVSTIVFLSFLSLRVFTQRSGSREL